jgi:hypothetical protein
MRGRGESQFGSTKNKTPGPGQYNLNTSTRGNAGTIGNGKRSDINNEKDRTPGPGHFSVRP